MSIFAEGDTSFRQAVREILFWRESKNKCRTNMEDLACSTVATRKESRRLCAGIRRLFHAPHGDLQRTRVIVV